MGNIIAAIAVLGALGALFGLILSVASKIFEVKKDPREEAILSHLAGANCGGCGYPGCGGCAAAILAGNAPVTACAPAGPDNAAAIAEIMGMAAPTGERQVAFVRCNGGEAAKKRFEYVGVQDCLSATKVAAGPLECRFGCLGFGSCVNACQFGAMSIGPNGTAVVDPEKCTNCGACMKACPRGLITSVPVSKKVHVACANLDKGKAAMSVCGNSCIGCGLCEKECKKDAIHVVNGVAVIDYDKCVGCKLCTKVCPRDAILPKATAEEKEKYKAIKKAQAEKAAAAKPEDAKLADAAEGELPSVLVESTYQQEMQNVQQQLQMQRMTLNSYLSQIHETRESFTAKLHAGAEKNTRARMALLQIAQQENLVPTDEEIDKMIAERAERTKKTVEEIREKTNIPALKRTEAIRRAADWVIERSTIEEK